MTDDAPEYPVRITSNEQCIRLITLGNAAMFRSTPVLLFPHAYLRQRIVKDPVCFP